MPNRTRPHVYLAGPFSKPYPIDNMRTALQAANELLEFDVAHPFVPHLTGFWDFAFPRDYEQWLSYDAESLRACDAVWRLPGESSGADSEVRLAQSLSIPVYEDLQALLAFCRDWILSSC